uniref:Uncharacterized protein n=1 Tax=Anguilla anguilla TaxID=7936 RepID=A0A0E9TSI2_ANGAN
MGKVPRYMRSHRDRLSR